jgi:GNAT superfamily N-acetyltransferase
MPGELVHRTRIAVADAWQAEGLLRESRGGAAAEFRDVRVMASGLRRPHWNNADITGPDPDLEAAHAFYAERGLPWAIRVGGRPWPYGRHVMAQRLMALVPHGFQPAQAVEGLQLALAGPDEVETVAAVDAAAFGEDPQTQRPWIEPHLGAASVETALATLGGQPVATAYTLRSNGRAGPALYLGGVAVLEGARRQGVAAAMSSRLLQRGFAAGAQLAHLHADTEQSARVFARLGFHEAGELDIYAVERLDPIAVKPYDPR